MFMTLIRIRVLYFDADPGSALEKIFSDPDPDNEHFVKIY